MADGVRELSAINFIELCGVYSTYGALMFYLLNYLNLSLENTYAFYGLFFSLKFLCPVLMAPLIDRYIGAWWSLVLGMLMMAAGFFLLINGNIKFCMFGLSVYGVGWGAFKNSLPVLNKRLAQTEMQGQRGVALVQLTGCFGMLTPGLYSYIFGMESLRNLFVSLGMLFVISIVLFAYKTWRLRERVSKLNVNVFHATYYVVATLALIYLLFLYDLIVICISVLVLYICVLMSHIYRDSNRVQKKNTVKVGAIILYVLIASILFNQIQVIQIFLSMHVVGHSIIPFSASSYITAKPFLAILYGASIYITRKKQAISVKTLTYASIIYITTPFMMILSISVIPLEPHVLPSLFVLVAMPLLGLAVFLLDTFFVYSLPRLAPAKHQARFMSLYYFTYVISGYISRSLSVNFATAGSNSFVGLGVYKNYFFIMLLISASLIVVWQVVQKIVFKNDESVFETHDPVVVS